MLNRLQIAEELLGCALVDGLYAPCPGKGKHTSGDGPKDFRVVLNGAPTGFCFHSKCSDEVAAFNLELRRRVWFAENGRTASAPKGHWGEGIAPEPKPEAKARPELDRAHVWEFTRGVPEVPPAWFHRRSPHGVESCESAAFLRALYRTGERVLVFSDHRSQGDFIAWMGEEPDDVRTYRLSQHRGTKAVPSPLPKGAKEGVWFLTNPVTGLWDITRNKTFHADPVEAQGAPEKYTRRSQVNVTAWRYFVLESDELEAETWLKVLATLPLPIAAIYTSGGRSIHALVLCDVETKEHWDVARNIIRQIACPLGADPAALSAVRLSRLPGCKRGERMQELIYLNPEPSGQPIRTQPELR